MNYVTRLNVLIIILMVMIVRMAGFQQTVIALFPRGQFGFRFLHDQIFCVYTFLELKEYISILEIIGLISVDLTMAPAIFGKSVNFCDF